MTSPAPLTLPTEEELDVIETCDSGQAFGDGELLYTTRTRQARLIAAARLSITLRRRVEEAEAKVRDLEERLGVADAEIRELEIR